MTLDDIEESAFLLEVNTAKSVPGLEIGEMQLIFEPKQPGGQKRAVVISVDDKKAMNREFRLKPMP